MFPAAHRSSSGALTVFAASGLHTYVGTGRSQSHNSHISHHISYNIISYRIPYHIISYHIISYIISHIIISYIISYITSHHIKGSRCLGLTSLPTSCADYLEILTASTCWCLKGLPRPVRGSFTFTNP
jgi:hypothetical protein